MTDHILESLTRRRFIRKVGVGFVSITIVDFLLGGPRLTFACGEGTADATCGGDSNKGTSKNPTFNKFDH
jgi:hypothetical protein